MSTPDEYEKGSNRVVIDVIRDLTKRLEVYEQASGAKLIEYEKRSSAERTAMKRSLEANMVQFRKDFHLAISPLQIDASDHRKTHDVDRLERVNRQASNDHQMYLIRIVLLVMGGVLVAVFILLMIGIIIVVRGLR